MLSNCKGTQSHICKAVRADKCEGAVERREGVREGENKSVVPYTITLNTLFGGSFMQWEGRHQPSLCQIIIKLEFRGTHINEVFLNLYSVRDHISLYPKRQTSK